MPARTVEGEAENLHKEVDDRMALAMLVHGAKDLVEVRKKLDATKIADKEIQPGPPGQAIRCDLDGIDATETLGLGPGHG